jgi:uncharacterized protein YycO
MIHEYEINGIQLRTGDIICTTDGGAPVMTGQFWRFIGNLIPGDVDHVAMYVGPEGRCVEAGALGRVVEFTVRDHIWDALALRDQRGEIVDMFYGVAFPVEGRDLPEAKKREVRERAAQYCLKQAAAGKPYNLSFCNSRTEDTFYSSQLVYMAYLHQGIGLNTGMCIPSLPGTSSIIFPQEIWSGCLNRRASVVTYSL